MGIVGAAFGLAVLGCTVDYKCESCDVKVSVPNLPDCIIASPGGTIRLCPDAGEAGDAGSE